ncbi:ADP-ribosylglycohydrolase family protein [Streptomyces sp. NE06-03E]|uniref:ADP-ribosylglycohydrolase family protein n=1 Tax=Streptomyces sp. gb1(2016) TaxID=1828321 RepID=A0A652KUJ5_9ACTN|nr:MULTISPECIES: ADP-ribosylglycohydrolase family protein [unclassified Streptomyces]WSS64210.1 ADP-ribosylglycohydrolase family protein [Streptomyces sp. NBC_01177]WSS78211.1 ADP-ribosylglycohydrolase family protein [Streptomyces sp. NBC_01174]MDX3055628.1 ADP-ribosylglycohydrolase family protein [Streptomyces sp. NE06-03E]MDX3430951.1 ADP-ribosylglycohydrolase family protein [Streptomyces sp. ME01-18a]TXS27379.1 ADP-ribosylglycohydrolase family protein [Streptomyces sp. gb1(2016)]
MNSPSRPGDSAAARRSLEALALGDAFGERWFPLFRPPRQAYAEVRARRTPHEPVWHWTDDTALALALQRVLDEYGHVEQDRLALYFALAFDADQARGYGHGMHVLLPELLTSPADWRTLAPGLFEGGSLGNGAAMRVAPLGARFHADLGLAAGQAVLSAVVTHAHPEGVAGAVAVAVAAALSVRGEFTLEAVAEHTPQGAVRDGVLRAAQVPFATDPWKAADLLGNGSRIRADDTVPFALWTAARHPGDLETALWATAEGFGDVDTTCAITAGVVGAVTGVEGVPAEWRLRREPLG